MLRVLALIPVLLAVLMGPRIFNYHILLMGRHKVVNNHYPGPCNILKGIEHGSEDMKLLGDGLAIITSGLRYTQMMNPLYKGRKGRMFLFDFNKPQTDPVLVTIEGLDLDTFDPSGLDIWRNPNTGVVHVYVVNFLAAHTTVEKLRLDLTPPRLVHEATLTHTYFRVVNNLVLFGEDQFYFTNYMQTRSAWELHLLQELGTVGWYDRGVANIVWAGMLIPNGITASLDRKHLFVSHLGYREVLNFEIQKDNLLQLKQTFKTYSLQDNLNIDPETGNIWTGAHPMGLTAFAHLADPINVISPSQVLNLKIEDGIIMEQIEVLQDDGKIVSGSTSAVYYKGGLLVGTMAGKTMYCEVRYLH